MGDKPDKTLLIVDQYQTSHQLEAFFERASWIFHVRNRGGKIGRLRGSAASTNLLIGDILIHDGTPAISNELGNVPSVWRRLFRLPERNWQNRGLGSAMLKFAISEARERGLKSISGSVVEDSHGRLERFYVRHGFSIVAAAQPPLPNALYGISMVLDHGR